MKRIFSFATILTAIMSLSVFTTSCEDMFTADNELVTTQLAPQDTLYSIMGIVHDMQKLATRTVLFGELRADLVSATSHATKAIQQISENNIDVDNEYNNPTDYYAVINDCNIYLANVDTALVTHGDIKFEKEILAAKIFRAWTYLELVKVYGQVPFITDQVLTAAEAEEQTANAPKKDMEFICEYFIKELEDYMSYNYRWSRNLDLRPSYASNYAGASIANFFIPVRVMLGELNLWLGSVTKDVAAYKRAVQYYHDFLTFAGEEHPTGYNRNAKWGTRNFDNKPGDSYASGDRFKMGNITGKNTDVIAYIPVDTLEYYGNTSDLREIFCATFTNDYYSQVSPSARLKELSAEPWYCYFDYRSQKEQDTLYAPRDVKKLESESYLGDLRYSAVCNIVSELDKYHDYNSERQYILKYTEGSTRTSNDERLRFVPLYRVSIIYLHMAEALNRAGFPETAFAVLKYGLTDDLMHNRDIISPQEFEGLLALPTIGYTTSNTYGEASSAAFWDHTVFINYDPTLGSGQGLDPTQEGIHNHGSGDSPQNAHYALPHNETIWAKYNGLVADSLSLTKELHDWMMENPITSQSSHEDSVAFYATVEEYHTKITAKYVAANEEYPVAYAAQRLEYPDFVAQKILEEEALEGMFEGYRFYDLMRWEMFYGTTDFLATEVGKRAGTAEGVAPVPEARLTGNKWYLPLRKR